MRLIFSNERRERLSDRTSIGRSADNTIRIDHEGTSRAHALIQRREGIWTLTDLGSNNGTTVNGLPVVRQDLKAGDVISFGGTSPAQTATLHPEIEADTAIGAGSRDLDRTDSGQGLAEVKAAIATLSERNEELHRKTDERIDRLEARTTAMETEHTAAVQAWTAESRLLRAQDAEQVDQIKRFATVFLGLICFSLATTCTVQVAQSLQRNHSISAAINDAIDPDSLGRLLGALVSGTMTIALAQLTVKDQDENDGRARSREQDLSQPGQGRGH